MAITAVSPISGSRIDWGDSFSFTVDDTYTSMVIKVQTSTALEKAYDSALSGAQAGYTVVVVDNGDGTHTFTTSRDAGFDKNPTLIYVEENESGSTATTNISYLLAPDATFVEGTYPYNPPSTTNDAVWGLISGTLSNQTDLQAALDLKADITSLTGYVLTAGTRAQDAILVTERADHVNTPAATKGELWLKSDAVQKLMFTDDAGNDFHVTMNSEPLPGTDNIPVWDVNDKLAASELYDYSGQLTLTSATASVSIKERTTGPTVAASYGQVWVQDSTPSTLAFTDDASTLHRVVLTNANLLDGYIPTWTSNSDDQAKLDCPGDLYYAGGSLRLQHASTAELLIKERASMASSFAGYGHLWVKNDAPTTLWFRNDSGVDQQISGLTLDKIINAAGVDNDVNVPPSAQIYLRNNTASIIPLTCESTNTAANAFEAIAPAAGRFAIKTSDGTDSGFLGPRQLKLKEAAAPGLTNGAGEGSIWIKNTIPSTAIYRTDTNEDLDMAAETIIFQGAWDGTGTSSIYYYSGAGEDTTYTSSSGATTISSAIGNNWRQIGGYYFPNGGKILSADFVMAADTAAGGGGQNMEWVIASQNLVDNATAVGGTTTHVTYSDSFSAIRVQTGTGTIADSNIIAGDLLKAFVRQTNASMTGGSDIRGTIVMKVLRYL